MDERIEKAFGVANFMATLSNQKRIILEEYNQKLIHYVDGATFKVTPELISFIKTLVDLKTTKNIVLVDSNHFPVLISDLKDFLEKIVEVYTSATSEYANRYNEIKTKRKIADIVDL
jgi:hypothetical protein